MQPTGNICPFCSEEGEKSLLYPSPNSSRTLMMGHHYYDENGVGHFHDPNTSTRSYRCSRGHSWVEKVKPGCSGCDTPPKVDRILSLP